MATSLNSIFEAIGSLKSEVVALRRDVEDMGRDQARVGEAAAASRAVLHRRMDELVDRTGALEGDMAAVKGDMTEVKSVTDDVTRWKLMGLGALGVTGIAFASIGSALTYFWSDLRRILFG